MAITVMAYSDEWPRQFEAAAASLREALADVPVDSIEHVGSTAVPGLAAKPILDIDVVVGEGHVRAAVRALEAAGYEPEGHLGFIGREALRAPDEAPARHVYVCVAGALQVRSHLAARHVLRERADLRSRYAAVKRDLAAVVDVDADRYGAGKSAVLREVLAASDLTDQEVDQVFAANRLPDVVVPEHS